MAELLYPYEGYVFDTHTEIQNEFIRRIQEDGIDSALVWLEPVKNERERSYPNSLLFQWKRDFSDFSVLEVSKTDDFSDAVVITTKSESYEMNNLEIGTKYFWRVNGGEVRTFETLGNSPRFIKIDGLLNVRDIGGNAVKQGLVYRGTELNGTFTISEEGKRVFADELGIKTELDLRRDQAGVYERSAAGEGVALVHLPYRPYMEIFEEEHKKGICKIMAFFADESNYPIYVHCMGGADRTGMIAIFLRALLGESDEDIHLDYELTGLSTYAAGAAEGAHGFRRRNSEYYAAFLTALDAYAPLKSLSEQVKAFLLDCGVKTEHIEKIVVILKNM